MGGRGRVLVPPTLRKYTQLHRILGSNEKHGSEKQSDRGFGGTLKVTWICK